MSTELLSSSRQLYATTFAIVYKGGIGLLTALILWEIILTNFVVSVTGRRDHPVIGNIPAQKEGPYFQASEGYCQTRINALGLRGPDLSPRTVGEVRVLVLGDSFTEAFQVADQATFSAVAQVHASRMLQRKVTVVNCGKSGLNPAHYIHLAPVFLKLFNPDLTVVQVTDNDFYFELLQKNGTCYVQRVGNKFVTIEPPISDETIKLLGRYPPIYFFNWFGEFRVSRRLLRNMTLCLSPTPVPFEVRIRAIEAAPHSELDAATAWALRALKGRYGRVVMLHIPTEQLSGGTTIGKMEQRLARLARDAEFDEISLRQDFDRAQRWGRQPMLGFSNTVPGQGHLNEFGHAIVGKRLADYIISRFLISSDSRFENP